jgi:hypothetical protein
MPRQFGLLLIKATSTNNRVTPLFRRAPAAAAAPAPAKPSPKLNLKDLNSTPKGCKSCGG